MIGDAWLHKRKAVELRRSRVTPAAVQEVRRVLSREDLAMLSDHTAFVTRVPVADRRLLFIVQAWASGNFVLISERVSDEPDTLVSLDRTSGVTTTVALREGRGGTRIDLRLSCEAERPVARQMLDGFEVAAVPWLEAVVAIAEGRQPFPVQRPDLILIAAGEVGPASANLPATGFVNASVQECWDLRVPNGRDPGARFWATPGPPGVGSWMGTVWARERLSGQLTEVVEYEPPVRITLRSLAGDNHPSLISWRFSPAPEGTRVDFNHRCATSHVGLRWSAEDVLAQMKQALADR